MFPKVISLKKNWIAAIKRDEGPEFGITETAVVMFFFVCGSPSTL